MALPGRVSRRDPAVPVRGVRRCSCSRVAIPSRDPGTRLQGAAEWCYHSRQAGTPRKGDQPKDWRATDPKTSGHQPKDWAGRGYFLTLSAPTCSSWTLVVTCPRSRVAVVYSLLTFNKTPLTTCSEVESPFRRLKRRRVQWHCPRAPTQVPSNIQRAPTQETGTLKCETCCFSGVLASACPVLLCRGFPGPVPAGFALCFWLVSGRGRRVPAPWMGGTSG